jgi:hypothetical protein
MYQLPHFLHFPSWLLGQVQQTMLALVVLKLNREQEPREQWDAIQLTFWTNYGWGPITDTQKRSLFPTNLRLWMGELEEG